jgi:hypothetical protein
LASVIRPGGGLQEIQMLGNWSSGQRRGEEEDDGVARAVGGRGVAGQADTITLVVRSTQSVNHSEHRRHRQGAAGTKA